MNIKMLLVLGWDVKEKLCQRMALRYTCVCGGPACGAGRRRRRRGRHRRCHVHGWRRTQETSETRWVSAVVTDGSGEVPRARETAGASSRASRESIGDGGSGVSAARRVAASCHLTRCSCGSSLSRGRGAGKATLSRRRRGAASSRPAAGSWGEVVARVGGRGRSWRTGHLFGTHLSSASGLELRWEAVGRGRCPSQKGSGAEAVCLEWRNQRTDCAARASCRYIEVRRF
jgi:hypothetical protein